MSIPIPLLQSQQALNRTELNSLYNELERELDFCRHFKAIDDKILLIDTKSYLAYLRKRIARLVKLQKAIKAELQLSYSFERANTKLNQLVLSGRAIVE